jgi:hypothetical protein
VKRPDHGEAEVTGAGKERGGGAGGPRGDAGVGLGFWGSEGPFCRAAALPWRAGPEEGGRRGSQGGVASEKKGRKEKGALTRGAGLAERERRGGCVGWPD